MNNEEAISILYHLKKCLNDDMFFEAIEHAVNALENEPKKGNWIDVNGDGSLWKCSSCGEKSCCRGKYCPDCGADMREGEENEKTNL